MTTRPASERASNQATVSSTEEGQIDRQISLTWKIPRQGRQRKTEKDVCRKSKLPGKKK